MMTIKAKMVLIAYKKYFFIIEWQYTYLFFFLGLFVEPIDNMCHEI